METSNSRRLTGPNLLQHGAGAAIDVTVDADVDVTGLVAAWESEVTRVLRALGEDVPTFAHRRFEGGVSLAFTAPIDRLYTMCEVNEAALAAAADGGRVSDDVVAGLRVELADEVAPDWLALSRAANERGVPLLWDDDEFSLGLGRTARTWPVDGLPSTDAVDPDVHGAIPVVLVTGTNGKSTTVRLAATLVDAPGRRAGHTSTDGIRVAGELVEAGDWSGPGGARTLLRRNDVDVAILEVARGGMLRRGLPVDRADVAVVTNISDDHLGEYGIETVEDLAQAKLVVAKAIGPDGLLVLNADDPLLVAAAPAGVPTAWFTLDPSHPMVGEHVAAGGTALTVVDGIVVERRGTRETPVVAVADVPMTLDGAAAHNVANLLAAVAVARRLRVERDDIATRAATFRGDPDDNPGRANRFDLDGVQVLVDFAHNPAGMRAILSTAAAMPSDRRLVMFGQAGDRSVEAIDDLTRAVWATRPDHVIASEVPNYLRGRDPMSIPAQIRETLLAEGAPPARVTTAATPLDGARAALDWSRPGDLVVLMTLEMRDAVLTLLRARGATPI